LVTKPRKLLKTFYENFLRKLLKTSNPTLFQSSTFGYAILRKLLKTSNPTLFLQLPILHFWTKTWNFQFLHFWLRKLETSNPLANFRFLELENLKNPTIFLQLPILPYLDFSLMKSWFSATFPQNVCFEQNLVVFPKFAPIFFFFFFFLTKWTFLQKFNPQKVPKMFIILLFLVLLLLQTFPTSTSYFLNNFYFLSLPNSQICLLFAVTSWTSTITRIFSLFLSLCKPKFFSKWKKTTKSGGFCSD